MGYVAAKCNHKSIVLLCNLRNTAIVCFGYVYVPDSWYGDSIGQVLWTGTWSSGSITVPGLSDYVLFAARLVDSRIWITGFSARNDSAFRLSSNHISNTPNVFAYALNALRDGNKLTMDIAGYANVLGENVYPSTVCEIVGIL